MELKALLTQIFSDSALKGVSRQALTDRAGLLQPAVSRIMHTGDCRFSTINKLLKASGLKLVVVPDHEEAEKLTRGELF